MWQEGGPYLPAEFLRHYLGIQVQAEAGSFVLRAYAKGLRVIPGQMTCRLGYDLLEAPAAPQLHEGHLYVPLGLLTKVYSIAPAGDEQLDPADELRLKVPEANVVDMRYGSHSDKARVVIDLDAPASFLWGVEQNTLLMDIATEKRRGEDEQSLRLLTFDDELVSRISQSLTADGFTRIIIAFDSAVTPHVFTLMEPARIVVDIPRPAAPEPSPPTKPPEVPGKPVKWQVRNFGTPRGPVRVHVLKISPAQEGLSVRPALAGPTIHQRRSVLNIAREQGAVAALNGGFYASPGAPLGLLIIDGEWIRAPLPNRSVWAVTFDGKLLMGSLDFDGRLHFQGHGYLQLAGLNGGHDDNDGVIVCTRRWGERLAGSKSCTRLTVKALADDNAPPGSNGTGAQAAYSYSGMITVKETAGREVEIPADGYVISGRGRHAELLARLEPGEEVTLKLNTKPAWQQVRHALGAGPRLVKDGTICITAQAERFRWDVSHGISPRSALGITKEGELLLVAAEPEPDSSARGLTLDELAATMIKLGAWQAMNLDGGGSTSVIENGQVLNRPADGWLRRVSNALVVIAKPPATASKQ